MRLRDVKLLGHSGRVVWFLGGVAGVSPANIICNRTAKIVHDFGSCRVLDVASVEVSDGVKPPPLTDEVQGWSETQNASGP